MAEVGASVTETLMGDTTHDLELASRGRAGSVAVGYGAHRTHGLARFAPLATAHSVAELREWDG